MRALLIEDDPASVALILAQLIAEPDLSCDVVSTLGAAADRLDSADILMLDLTLPDSQGFSSITDLRALAPELPVVIVTGSDDPELPLQALEAGAQDYLRKDHLDDLPTRLRMAVARQRFSNRRVNAAPQPAAAAHLDLSETLRREQQVSLRHLGLGPLKDALPDVFSRLQKEYRTLLEASLATRTHRGRPRPTVEARSLATTIAGLNAVPRDLVDLHVATLDGLADDVHPDRVAALADEGRLVLLEVMGHLAMAFRTHYPGRTAS